MEGGKEEELKKSRGRASHLSFLSRLLRTFTYQEKDDSREVTFPSKAMEEEM